MAEFHNLGQRIDFYSTACCSLPIFCVGCKVRQLDQCNCLYKIGRVETGLRMILIRQLAIAAARLQGFGRQILDPYKIILHPPEIAQQDS